MKVLVTGSAGFIGMHTAKRLLAGGHEVVGVDSLNPYYDVALKRARLQQLAHPRFEFRITGRRHFENREYFRTRLHLLIPEIN